MDVNELAGLCHGFLDDPGHGWSLGTFGAVGEFMRDRGEAVECCGLQLATARGAIRITPVPGVQLVAYDTLSADGETWGHAAAFCLPRPVENESEVITPLGPDVDAVREQDRGVSLFDLGVGAGSVRMAVRSADPELVALLEELAGRPLLSPEVASALMPVFLRAAPHRVTLSPLGRVEVFQPIPPPDGKSPEGPHTHLLPKLIPGRRTHSANTPIPEGWQPMLALHPRSPWRDMLGHRKPFDAGADGWFLHLVEQFGLVEDRQVRADVEAAVADGADPAAFAWPDTRRGRTQARITLRRLHQCGGYAALPVWRARYDALEPDAE